MDRLVFEISEVVPSLNRLLRMHWTARRRLQDKWRWLVWTEIYARGGPERCGFTDKVQIRILRRSRKILDDDNLHGSAKIVLDAIKNSKVISDDNPLHVSLICQQELGKPLTTVWVTPVNVLIRADGSPDEPVVSLEQC